MSWRSFYYGVDQPSYVRRVVIYCLIFSALLMVYGYHSRFALSPWGVKFGLYASIATTFGLTAYLWHGYSSGKIPFRKTASKGNRVLALLVIPVAIFGVSWLILARSVPDLFARAIGSPSSLSVELKKYDHYLRRQCDYQVRGAYLTSHLCVSLKQFNRLPLEGMMTISGKATIFGMHVVSIEPAETTTPHITSQTY